VMDGYPMQMVNGTHDRQVLAFALGHRCTCLEFAVMSRGFHLLPLRNHPENNRSMCMELHQVVVRLNALNSFRFLNKSPFLSSFLNHNVFVVPIFVLLIIY